MKSVFSALMIAAEMFIIATGVWHTGCDKGVAMTVIPADTLTGSVSILFAGDVMQHMPQVNAARTGNGFDYDDCFKYMAPLFNEADVTVVNLETTLSRREPYSGYPRFSSPAQLADGLKRAGVDVALNANNHICDAGIGGMETTVEVLDSLGIAHTGAFVDIARADAESPLLIDKNGVRIALMNYTYGTNGLAVPAGAVVNLIDSAAITSDIAEARERKADFIFVVLHWGEEYERRPRREQRRLAEMCRNAGADFVIGSHPHVVQPLGAVYDSTGNTVGAVVYSLGNFVSAQTMEHTDGGLIVRFDLGVCASGKRSVVPSYLPVWRYKSITDGRTRFTVLPPQACDTVKMEEWQRNAWRHFLKSTDTLLGKLHGFALMR